MRFLVCLILLGTVATVYGIKNGVDAKENEFPYLAYIRRQHAPKAICGGAIISKHFVLTACHCVFEVPANKIYIFTGRTKLVPDLNHLYKARKVVCHHGYLTKEDIGYDRHHDVALIQPSMLIETGPEVQIYPLHSDFSSVENEIGLVAGWGEIRNNSGVSKHLQKIEIKVLDDKCEDYWVDKNYICTLDDVGENGPERGDSGGPIVIKKQIVGIVSKMWFVDNTKVATYARVAYYLSWIENMMRVMLCSEDVPEVNPGIRHSI